MATYNQVSYGSKGSDVTELQKLLNNKGYSLSVDGIFGSQTQAAVKDYQQKNSLAVDGIVGTNTWGALTKASTPTASTTQTASPTTQAKTFDYGTYKPSDAVTQAQQLLSQQLAQKPGAYQSPWQTQLNDIIQQIMNREKFSYDLNGDMLYQQYKGQAIQNGRMAMMDTMGQAAALTGGYGNSWAQSVGQQAYHGELQKLNDKIPELYQLALSKYQMEGDAMYDQAALMAQQEEQDYGRYRDQVSDYYTELDRLTEDARYQEEQDYGKWADGRDFAYGQFADDRAYDYQVGRDKVADEQWQAEFDEAKRQFDQQYALKTSGGSSSSTTPTATPTATPTTTKSTGTTPNYDKTYSNQGYSADVVMEAQRFLGGVTLDGLWGPNSAARAKEMGYNSLADVVTAMNYKNTQPQKASTSGFTGSTYGEATAYLKSKGASASGLMTQSEWQRHKNGKNSAGGEHEASTYKEYLAAFIYGATK